MKQECESIYHEFCWVINNFPFLFFDILLSKKATSCQASWFCHENHGLNSHLSVSQKGTKNLNILNNVLSLQMLNSSKNSILNWVMTLNHFICAKSVKDFPIDSPIHLSDYFCSSWKCLFQWYRDLNFKNPHRDNELSNMQRVNKLNLWRNMPAFGSTWQQQTKTTVKNINSSNEIKTQTIKYRTFSVLLFNQLP